MAAQYGRAMAEASPQQQAVLQQTRDRFLGYRDRCPNNSCIGDAYVGRMREIRDIMEGRWKRPIVVDNSSPSPSRRTPQDP